MKRRSYIQMAIGLAVLLLLIALWRIRNDREQTDWKTHLDKDSLAPFGAAVTFQVLDPYFGQPMLLVEDSLIESLPLGRRDLNYIFLGDGLLMDTSAVNHLLQFVHSGNAALLIAREFPQALLAQLYEAGCHESIWFEMETFIDTTAFLQPIVEEPTLPRAVPVRHIRDRLPRYRRWSYLPDYFFCETVQAPIALGNQPGDFTNFARFTYGVGEIYLHTTPLAFSNFNMREERQLNYASWVFSHLPGDRNTYWDHFHQFDADIVRNIEQDAETDYSDQH
ncbi:MAG: hypothetical protein KDC44_16425, partial [Phaeodactylibacter sp.]|nr:hypothetical protein [Phaeodactylibacter sp.]